MLPQAEVSIEDWILLSDSLITLQLCAMSCNILFLCNFVIPGSDLHTILAVHELQHQAISFFLDTNHILVFENVSLDYHVKLEAYLKRFYKWQLI